MDKKRDIIQCVLVAECSREIIIGQKLRSYPVFISNRMEQGDNRWIKIEILSSVCKQQNGAGR